MKNPVLIALTAITLVAAAASVYLFINTRQAEDVRERRSTALIIENPADSVRGWDAIGQELRLGLDVPFGQLMRTDWATGRKAGVSAQAVIRANMDYAASFQFDTLVLDLAAWAVKDEIVDDVTPDSGRDRRGSALLRFAVAEAHRRKLSVIAALSPINFHLARTAAEVDGGGRSAALELAKRFLERDRLDGLAMRHCGISMPECIAIQQVTQRKHKVFLRLFDDSGRDGGILLASDRIGLVSTGTRVERMEHDATEYRTIGYATMVLGYARARDRPAWVEVRGGEAELDDGAARNLLLLRAAQFAPAGYLWRIDTIGGSTPIGQRIGALGLRADLTRLQRRAIRARPTVNVILAFPSGERLRKERKAFIDGVFGPVTNGLMLAGYQPLTTYGDVIADAMAYVVLAVADTPKAVMDLPDELLALLDQYKPVIFVVDGLSAEGNWRRALPKLGVKVGSKFQLSNAAIEAVQFLGERVLWHGETNGALALRTAVLGRANVSGEVVVSGMLGAHETELVVRNGNKVLVNCNALHLQASVIFNHLIKGTLHAPFFGYGTLGRRSVFMALRTSRLEVDLPVPEGAELRLIRYGSDGQRQPVEVLRYHEPLNTTLRRNELLVTEAADSLGDTGTHSPEE